mmetsp:Transcript_42115/g.71226  ORF Transcript_42115/g.71226 Transcript_42115/m.71226 type:complete len:144 (-) Transcript_42115:145-576(-)
MLRRFEGRNCETWDRHSTLTQELQPYTLPHTRTQPAHTAQPSAPTSTPPSLVPPTLPLRGFGGELGVGDGGPSPSPILSTQPPNPSSRAGEILFRGSFGRPQWCSGAFSAGQCRPKTFLSAFGANLDQVSTSRRLKYQPGNLN